MKRTQRGYVALLAILIIGAAATAIATGLLLTGTDSQRSTLVVQRSNQARNLATACAEEALEEIRNDTDYTGTDNLSLGQGTCTYTVTNPGGTVRTVRASGTVATVVRSVEVNVSIGATTQTVTTWQEVGTPSTVAHVQSNGTTNNASAATIAQALSSNVTAGNLLVASAAWNTASGTVTTISCSDNRGNAYSTVNVWIDATNARALGICYTANAAAGSTTVTVTFGNSNAVTTRRVIVSEYSGVAKVKPVDVTIGVGGFVATTGVDAVTSGPTTPSQNGDLIYGAVLDTTTTTTIAAGTGFTQRFSLNAKDLAVQDQQQTTAATIASTQTFGATHRYNAGMVAFRALPQ